MSASSLAGDTPDLVVVFAAGAVPTTNQLERLTTGASNVRTIAADGGADHARSMGVQIDVAVGDFDSASDQAQMWLHQNRADIRATSPAKDFSDLELALEAAMDLAPQRIGLLGVGGGRIDHQLVNLMVLADERWRDVEVQAFADDCLITVVRSEATFIGEPGSLLTILPAGGSASVSTVGLLYPLDGEELSPTAARGLSNVMATDSARVIVETGVVLVMQPLAVQADLDSSGSDV